MGLISLTTKIFHKEVFLMREEYIMEPFKMRIFSFIVQEYKSKGQFLTHIDHSKLKCLLCLVALWLESAFLVLKLFPHMSHSRLIALIW